MAQILVRAAAHVADCEAGEEMVDGRCVAVLRSRCPDFDCRSLVGYDCLYNDWCSCAEGYTLDPMQRRCKPTDGGQVACDRTIAGLKVGLIRCAASTGCWNVETKFSDYQGCSDIVYHYAGIVENLTCTLAYQGYSRSCYDFGGRTACISCFPGDANSPVSSGALFALTATAFCCLAIELSSNGLHA